MSYRGRQPLLNLRLFADRAYTPSVIASVFVTFILFGGLSPAPTLPANPAWAERIPGRIVLTASGSGLDGGCADWGTAHR